MSVLFTTKFVRLLQTFDEKELKAFDSWLRSPWCNSNKNLIRLFGKLRKYHPDLENEQLTKEKLFRQVLPDGKFSHRRMNNLMSEGYLAAERFLIFQRFSRDESHQKRLLAAEFQSRHLDDWFFRESQKEIERLEEIPAKAWEEELSLLQLYRRIYHHPSQEPRMQAGQATISRMNEQLELAYTLEKAALINEMIFRNRLLKGENHNVAEELKKWEVVSEGLQHPAIELYRMRFAYMKKGGLPQYRTLRTAFHKRRDELSEKEQRAHLLSLLNDTMALIKSGQLDITECLPLYQLGLKTGAIFNQGQLTRNTYTLIVSASNTEGSFDFTRHFIDTYTTRLDEKIQADCAAWASAHTAYWKGELEASLNILQGHIFKAPYFQMIGRVLNTQAYFDLYLRDASYEDYLFHFFDTFEKWLSREKAWSKDSKKSFLRFVQKCRALARHYAAADLELQKVETLLESEKNIQALDWLYRKQKEVIRRKTGSPAGL